MRGMSSDFADRAFAFACDIVRLYRELPASVPQVIKTQLLKSATSAGANLEEARAASSRKDLRAKFAIGLREMRETLYWLRLIASTRLAPVPMLAARIKEASELVAILTAAVKELRKPAKTESDYPEQPA